MLHALILQTAVTAATSTPTMFLPAIGWELLVIIGANISFIWTVITWKVGRMDKSAAEKQKAKDEERAAFEKKYETIGAQVANQHNMLMEAGREFQKAKAEADARYQLMNQKVEALAPLPGKVSSHESKFELLTEQVRQMKEDIKDIKTEVRASATETRADLKALTLLIQTHYDKS